MNENKDNNVKPTTDQNKKSFTPGRDNRADSNSTAPDRDDDNKEKRNLEEYIQPNPKKPIDPTVEGQS